ncbi:MAG: YicC family protein [Planctomycetes bacterium]|nr:YicC family protein [Planctomycetota bacterium]
MTGYGDASADRDGVHYTVEMRSVNNRYLKATIRLPDQLLGLEPELDAEVRKRITRGSVTLTVAFKDTSAKAAYAINEAALKEYLSHLQTIEQSVTDGSVTIDLGSMLALPGIVQQPDQSALLQSCRPVVHELMDKACEKMCRMRQAEGEGLAADLVAHIKEIITRLEQVVERAPLVVHEYHQRLRSRIDELTAQAKLKLNEVDLIREVALFAERCDISEEIQRLRAHLEQFQEILTRGDDKPAGRTLDFISQELLREANTIASKSNDALITRTIVEVKGAIDRIKEQVQNVE